MPDDVENMGRPKKPIRDLREEEVHKMLTLAKSTNISHYRMLLCLAYGAFRGGEITGNHDPRVPGLSGLLIQDLQDDGIWVNGKGGYRDFQPLRPEVITELKSEIGKRKEGRIFPYHRDTLYRAVQSYARRSGIADWKLIHPHSFRHFCGSYWARITGRDPWKVGDMMRHRSLGSTRRYVQKVDVEEGKKLSETLAFV